MNAKAVEAGAPAVPATAARGGEVVPVYVWDLVVRWTHWLIVLSLAVLAVTGLYIGNPFGVFGARQGTSFLMGWVRTVHSYGAIVFTLAVLSRILWMFVGSPLARWSQFLPVARERRRGIPGTLKFYLFVRREPPPFVGHNPVAGATYTLVFALYLVMIGTGLGLYSLGASYHSPGRWFGFLLPLFGGAAFARLLHHVVMWLLIGFAVHHVYSAILVAIVERNGTLDSIFSGWKWVRRGDLEEEERAGKRARRMAAGAEAPRG